MYITPLDLVISYLMKKLGLKKYRGMEFDAAGVERISGCHVSVTLDIYLLSPYMKENTS